jgi:hypothetical protein
MICPAPLRQGNAAVRPEHDIGRVETGLRAARVDVIHSTAVRHARVFELSTKKIVREFRDH